LEVSPTQTDEEEGRQGEEAATLMAQIETQASTLVAGDFRVVIVNYNNKLNKMSK
jgi:hypothetical protein